MNIYSKYAWVILLKDKRAAEITKAFQKFVDEFNCKQSKTWADKGSKFCNRSIKSFLKKMQEKSIQYISKKNLFLLKDVLEPWKITWLQCQNMFILIT